MWRAGATLHCGARASHCSGFSCRGARALGAQASVAVAHVGSVVVISRALFQLEEIREERSPALAADAGIRRIYVAE